MKKALMVCSGNLDRSPTAAAVLAEMRAPFWVASAGTNPSSLNHLSGKMLRDADIVCVMEEEHRDYIRRHFGGEYLSKVHVLGIPDDFSRGEPRLKELLRKKLRAVLELPFGVG